MLNPNESLKAQDRLADNALLFLMNKLKPDQKVTSSPIRAWKRNFPPIQEIMTDQPTNQPSVDGHSNQDLIA